MKKILIILIILLSFFEAFSSEAQKITISPKGCSYEKLKSKDNKIVTLKHNIYNNHKIIFNYKNNCYKSYNGILSLDYTGDKIALSVSCKYNGKESKNQYYRTLIIISSKDEKDIISFNHGSIYSFSPDGNAIVYAEDYIGETGSAIPPGYQGGLWLYDFNTKTKKRIDTLGVVTGGDYRPQDVNWSAHDGNIYYTDYDKVFQFNVKASKGEIVPYKGIYFSPDGKYYVGTPYEVGTNYLYRTSDNREMVEWETTIKAVNKDSDYIYFEFWSKKLNAVIFRISNTENVIFDVGKGKVIGKFYGGVLGTNADGSLVAVNPVKEDNKNTYDQTQVEIINLQEVICKYKSGK